LLSRKVSTTMPQRNDTAYGSRRSAETTAMNTQPLRNQVLCSRSEEFSEGIRAFLEKRKPVYIER
jgi:enoyl-CoA hydratase/carnithine racemase